jgi:hypothetical protein
MPSISIQKDEVSAVSAPSALGNKAEISPIRKHILMKFGRPLFIAIVGKRSSPFILMPLAFAYR